MSLLDLLNDEVLKIMRLLLFKSRETYTSLQNIAVRELNGVSKKHIDLIKF